MAQRWAVLQSLMSDEGKERERERDVAEVSVREEREREGNRKR